MEKIEITREEYEEYLRLKRKEENQRNLKNKKEQDNLHARIIAMSIKGMEDKKIVQELDGDLSRASIYKTLRIPKVSGFLVFYVHCSALLLHDFSDGNAIAGNDAERVGTLRQV